MVTPSRVAASAHLPLEAGEVAVHTGVGCVHSAGGGAVQDSGEGGGAGRMEIATGGGGTCQMEQAADQPLGDGRG